MEARETVPEDAHQCQFCTDFAYASMLSCSKCKFQYCICHGLMCGCPVPLVQLVYRWTTEELQNMLAKVESQCK